MPWPPIAAPDCEIEQLEPRFCPAGLLIENRHGNLLISGDPDGALVLDQIPATKWRITEGDDIVGKFRCRGGLLVDLGAGDDDLTINLASVDAPSRLVLDLGDGTNSLSITAKTDSRINGSVRVFGGDGDDTFRIGSVVKELRIGGSLTVSGGEGNDTAAVQNVNVAQASAFSQINALTLQNAVVATITVSSSEALPTSIDIGDGSRISGKTTILSGGENDTISLDARLSGPVLIGLGDGDNEISMHGIRFGSSLQYEGGLGSDILRLLGKTSVAGEFRAELGGGANLVESYTDALFERSVTVIGGGSSDEVVLGATVRGNVSLALGDGTNSAQFAGALRGTALQYFGGDDVDTVTYAEVALRAGVRIDLGGGNDQLTISSNAFASATFIGGAGEDRCVQQVPIPTGGAVFSGFETFEKTF